MNPPQASRCRGMLPTHFSRTHVPTLLSPPQAEAGARYSEGEIRRRVESCPKLASLQSVNKALSSLTKSDMSLTSQIAEIIQRDPSLSQRLLRMVNSVYFGLSARINNIEDAVFFLGLRQIREFSLATPVIEEMEQIQAFAHSPLPWKSLWSHSIGTAILTREILSSTQTTFDDDTDYLVGLLHNVGKIVMAYAFPDELAQVARSPLKTSAEVCALERQLIGWDHAQIGAYFLERHQLVEELCFSVRYHHDPAAAPCHQSFAAAVQVADSLVRHAKIETGFEKVDPVEPEAWTRLDGWHILYGSKDDESRLARASLANALARLPAMVNGLL
jgi:HD-like signal output (HDOD) protein